MTTQTVALQDTTAVKVVTSVGAKIVSVTSDGRVFGTGGY